MSNFNFEYMGDYLQYKDAKGNTLIVNGGIINETATGAVAEITDGAENIPVKSLTVTMNPIQDLHGQANPYPAGGGKNLLDINSITVGSAANWSVEVNGDTLSVTHKTEYSAGTPSFSFTQPSGTYVISIGSINVTGQVSLYVNGIWTETINNGDTFTIDSANTNEIKFSAQTGQTTVITKIQIEKGTTATSYAPYSNICPISGRSTVNVWRESTYDTSAEPVISIQLGDTIYGGTVDVINGVITVNRMTVDLGELMWIYRSDVGEGLFSTTNVNNYKFTPDINAICSALKYDGTVGGIALVTTDKSVCFYYAAGSTERLIYVYDTDYSDAVSFKNAMDGVQLVYELAQPIIVQLTPEQLTTLLGTNYIWSDADSVSVDYVADTKLYIQNAISDSV